MKRVYGDLIPKAECARRLHMGRARVDRLIKAGIIPAIPDPETGQALVSWTAYQASKRRAGELAAEQDAA